MILPNAVCIFLQDCFFNEGKLSACVFTEPEMEPDDTYLLDYALFFSSVLLDYYEATGDLETLRDLYDVAIDQIRIAMTQLNEKMLWRI